MCRRAHLKDVASSRAVPELSFTFNDLDCGAAVWVEFNSAELQMYHSCRILSSTGKKKPKYKSGEKIKP